MKQVSIVLLSIFMLIICGACSALVGLKYEKLWEVDLGQEGYERSSAARTIIWEGERCDIFFIYGPDEYKDEYKEEEPLENAQVIIKYGREFIESDAAYAYPGGVLKSYSKTIRWKHGGYVYLMEAASGEMIDYSDIVCPETAILIEKGDYPEYSDYVRSMDIFSVLYEDGNNEVMIRLDTPECSGEALDLAAAYCTRDEESGFEYYIYNSGDNDSRNDTFIVWNTDMGAIKLSAGTKKDAGTDGGDAGIINAGLARRITEQLGAHILPLTHKAPSGMSPKETVTYYYEQWNRKDSEKMNSVVCTQDLYYDDFVGFISVKLLECVEITDKNRVKEGFEPEWYDKKPYDIAYVETTFDVQYEDWTNTSLINGKNYCGFYLVKDTKDSDWIIVSMGQG